MVKRGFGLGRQWQPMPLKLFGVELFRSIANRSSLLSTLRFLALTSNEVPGQTRVKSGEKLTGLTPYVILSAPKE